MRETYGDMMEKKIAEANYHRVEVEEKMYEKIGTIISQDYLVNKHKIDEGRAFYIIEDIRYMFNNDFMDEPYSYIQKYIEANDKSMKPIIKMIDDIKYNMNLWWLKGNSNHLLNKK